jgi:rare lipoprotein A
MRHFIYFICIILIGCSTHYSDSAYFKEDNHPQQQQPKPSTSRYDVENDGAPINPKLVNHKPVKPAYEPMSRYGNPTEYHIDGKRYEVLKSAKGYREKGLASWYGTKFHSKRTSSGEPYDLYGMTAAHKTLPLPTYVKVTNLNNNREIIVKVNDRGPFHEGRIIDLSYGAASKLGILPTGTGLVEVEALIPAGTEDKAARYYLQVGAFNRLNQAEQQLAQLSHIIKAPLFIEQYKQYYVVRSGPFENKEQAEQLKMQLANNGIKDTFSMLQ